MSRRARQVEELRDLCGRGRVVRAVDLAFEHFAQFGYDQAVAQLLDGAVARTPQSDRARRRFIELCTSYGERAGPS
jgi:hypothetical protein